MRSFIGIVLLCTSFQPFANESNNEHALLKNYPECSQSINADCQAYVDALIANADNHSSVLPNRRDFGDCRDDWSCNKEDLKNYLGKNRGDLIGRPVPTPIPEPNTLLIFMLGIGLLVAGKTMKSFHK